MSGFLSSEAELALMGEEEEARRLFFESTLQDMEPPFIDGTGYYETESGPSGLSAPVGETDDLSSSFASRSSSPNPADLHNYGYLNEDGRTWRCAYAGCTSKAVFVRGCDLRKHYRRHSKSFFCRHEGCPQAVEGGFSSKKDQARHEAKHNPGIECEWEDCDRIFSRVDNMKDHVRRIHKKGK
ncbi:hypothetical protein MMC06_000195 [Schaereria dolodes]|nr:hypothetical protein [Schaereria dolodes]